MLYRKEIPKEDPFMPDEVRMEKHCKVCITQMTELGDGMGQYDMLQEEDRADHDPREGILVDDLCVVAPVLP